MLALLVLYGCKRQILDPLSPQTHLPQKAKLDKVKGFYEKGRYKNQPKRTSGNGNERMTAQDSARFKDFEPQWDKTEVELLPNNEKMLIVPVVRFLNVEYNQNIGFIRRLCIRVDANEDFLEANIVELVGNITFVKENYNAIFKNHKENTVISGFEGIISVYGLDYSVITQKVYKLGSFTKNTAIQYTNNLKVDYAIVTCGIIPIYGNDGIVGFIDTCMDGITITGGGGGSSWGGDIGSGGNTPSGSGSGGGGNYVPYTPYDPNTPLPCKGTNCPPQDTGTSWDIEEDDYIPTPEEQAQLVELRKIMKYKGRNRQLSKERAESELRLAKTLHKLKQRSPLVQKICDRIKTKLPLVPVLGNPNASGDANTRVSVTEVEGSGSTDVGVTANSMGIPQVNTSTDEAVFLEELIHALQHLERPYTNPVVKPDKDENTHMEFEAKLIGQIVFGFEEGPYMFDDKPRPWPQYIVDYDRWLTAITLENLAAFGNPPMKFTQANFEDHIKAFAAHPHPGYIHLQNVNFVPTRVPNVLFFLFQP